MNVDTTDRIARHLAAIAGHSPGRPPGSAANRIATDYVALALERARWPVTQLPFTARYWVPGPAHLVADGQPVAIPAPPYARPGVAVGAAAFVSTLAEIEALGEASDRIVILRDDLARPLMPKAFPFVEDADQRALIAALEAARPAAVLALVADEALGEPVFEDPDLGFLYATVPASAAHSWRAGTRLALELGGELADGEGINISAGCTKGERIVVCAHVDSKVETMGALDNGGGVASLLALAETISSDEAPVELVFFNGEDHYAAPGEVAWLAAGGLEGVRIVINLDGAGLRGHPTAVSTLALEEGMALTVRDLIHGIPNAVAGEPWFESDHAIFAMRGIPSIAITSGAPLDLLKRIAHDEDEDIERVDSELLAVAVRVVLRLLEELRVGGPAAMPGPR